MNIVISGLGIIGGSYARAIKKYTDHYVIGINRSPAPLREALECGAIDEMGDIHSLEKADMLILGTFPEAAVSFVRDNADLIPRSCIVTDTSGIKSVIFPELSQLSEKYGFPFVGCHPMAGKEKNGFGASDADLFKGASCILVPCERDDDEYKNAVQTVAQLAESIGFAKSVYTTPGEHDRMIAFTSQVPHALACAYVQSPVCKKHNGFSAGSYRDVSRVANINARLWTELFLENSDPLTEELDILISRLSEIRDAIKEKDSEKLRAYLEKSRQIKEELGE